MCADPHELRSVALHLRNHDAPSIDKVPGLLESAAETIERLCHTIDHLGGDSEAAMGAGT